MLSQVLKTVTLGLAAMAMIQNAAAAPLRCNVTTGPPYHNGSLALCLDGTSNITTRDSAYGGGGGYKNVAYLPDWSLDRHSLQDFPVSKLTHVMHTFAIPVESGSVILTDEYNDINRPMYDGTHGILEALFEFKKKNRNLKTMLSIGGIMNTANFAGIAADPVKRSQFVRSAVAIMTERGMDGIDIDWEYPETSEEGHSLIVLLEDIRRAMDDYSRIYANGYHFELTAAVAAGYGARNLEFAAMDRLLDAWHVMAYDFKGSWEQGVYRVAGHHANIYPSPNTGVTGWSIENSINVYLEKGVPSQKLVLGMPLYGQAFQGTNGLGAPYDTVNAEKYGYKDLPAPGATVFYDGQSGASYSFDTATRELVSYDSPDSVRIKAGYLRSKNLGGAMWWEVSNDKAGAESLVGTVADALGNNWEQKQNLLCYPQAKSASMREHC